MLDRPCLSSSIEQTNKIYLRYLSWLVQTATTDPTLHFTWRVWAKTQHRSAYFFYQQLNLTMGLTFSRLFERMVRGKLCVVAVAAMATDYFGSGWKVGVGAGPYEFPPITLAVPMRRPGRRCPFSAIGI